MKRGDRGSLTLQEESSKHSPLLLIHLASPYLLNFNKFCRKSKIIYRQVKIGPLRQLVTLIM